MNEETIVRVRVLVEGWVQGVSFRYNTVQEAVRLGVVGWVRNLPDGRVEAVYEGPRASVEELLAWTRRGPQWAHVTSLAIHDEEPRGERGFIVG
jgi:acylphosphatase